MTFTLEETADGQARLRVHQVGFHGLVAQLTRRILAGDYPRILGQRLPAYLDRRAGTRAGPDPSPWTAPRGWRAYLGIFRRWGKTPASPDL